MRLAEADVYFNGGQTEIKFSKGKIIAPKEE